MASPETTYGSDKDGLVCGYLFSPGQPATPLDADAGTQWLDSRPYDDSESFVWLHEQNNRILFLLALVTVLALPFNVVGALFGMNVGGIPLASAGHGFWTIVVVVAVFTGVASVVAKRGRDR